MSAIPAAAETKDSTAAFGTLLLSLRESEQAWLENRTVYEEVPLYFQTDYPNTPYGRGTIASSGCGIVSLAMAATYLKDKEYLPDTLAEEFSGFQGNNVERIDYAIEALGLSLTFKPSKWEQAAQALKNGQIVILLVNQESEFTEGQHFIVLTGITKSGKVLVNDPYEPNYYKSSLFNGFKSGFSQSMMEIGFDGGWIFDRKEDNRRCHTALLEIYNDFQSEKLSLGDLLANY